MVEMDRRARHERHFIPEHYTQTTITTRGVRDGELDIFVAILD